MESLLKEYKQSLRDIKRIRESAPDEDQKIFAGMVGDLEYAIKWLKDERKPEPAKRRIILFSKPEYIDMFDLPSASDFSGCRYEEVENRIDEEMRRKKNDSDRKHTRRFRRQRV